MSTLRPNLLRSHRAESSRYVTPGSIPRRRLAAPGGQDRSHPRERLRQGARQAEVERAVDDDEGDTGRDARAQDCHGETKHTGNDVGKAKAILAPQIEIVLMATIGHRSAWEAVEGRFARGGHSVSRTTTPG